MLRCPGYGTAMYLSVLAPYLQTNGRTHGYFFDPDSLQQMVIGNSAAEEALGIVKVGGHWWLRVICEARL